MNVNFQIFSLQKRRILRLRSRMLLLCIAGAVSFMFFYPHRLPQHPINAIRNIVPDSVWYFTPAGVIAKPSLTLSSSPSPNVFQSSNSGLNPSKNPSDAREKAFGADGLSSINGPGSLLHSPLSGNNGAGVLPNKSPVSSSSSIPKLREDLLSRIPDEAIPVDIVVKQVKKPTLSSSSSAPPLNVVKDSQHKEIFKNSKDNHQIDDSNHNNEKEGFLALKKIYAADRNSLALKVQKSQAAESGLKQAIEYSKKTEDLMKKIQEMATPAGFVDVPKIGVKHQKSGVKDVLDVSKETKAYSQLTPTELKKRAQTFPNNSVSS